MFTAETKKATITNAVGNGTSITYTANNTFKVGEIIHISGIEPSNLNIPDAVVATRTNSQFTVMSQETGTRVSGGIAIYDALKNHLLTTSVINTQAKVIGEWNLNAANNIETIGSYRYANYGLNNDGGTHYSSILDAGLDTVVTESTLEMLVGQKITQISGDGLLSTSAMLHISEIISDIEFRVSEVHESSGSVVFQVADIVPSVYVLENSSTKNPGYYGATNSDVVVDGGFDYNDEPYVFKTDNEKQKLLYSLEDCFGKFRPRSGINKCMYLPGKRSIGGYVDKDMATRPRYYASSRYDTFKYWTSFRKVLSEADGTGNITANDSGIASRMYNAELATIENLITDTVPFVVYRDQVAANRIVVKMQTHVGEKDARVNKETPERWSIQKLDNENNWVSILEINDVGINYGDEEYVEVPNDGYIEFEYGVVPPTGYEDVFYHAGEYANANNLPLTSYHGYSYLVGASTTNQGTYYVWDSQYQEYITPDARATYEWRVGSQSVGRTTPLVQDVTNPQYYTDITTSATVYREFDFIKGLRLVIHTMNCNNATFDLIELSPRLAVDLSDKTTEFSVTKNASDLGNSGMPVGQLLSSVGKISLFDYDQAFNMYNTFDHEAKTGSIIGNLINRNLQIKLYEITKNVGIYDYYMPIKTMYADGFPQSSAADRSINIELKDQFTSFESFTAPELFIQDVSLSLAISRLLDSIGFSNYVFKRVEGQSDPTIPFFFVSPDLSVAEVLSELAVSTQHAMFFDEYNNFIIMSNEYMMPSVDSRDVDAVLYASKDYTSGDQNVKLNNKKLSNILDIKTELDDVYNDGKIIYKARSIQRDMKELKQSYAVDEGRTWIYKPVLLWEAPEEETTKSFNEQNNKSSAYALAAIPLNTTLWGTPPTFDTEQNAVINNIIDLGQGAYYLPRYNGYLYANGEIIRYDAVEYSVDGVGSVWITNLLEYKNYFSKLKFNGKIYPTGRVRIYTKLDEFKNVAVHGRAQFGTEISVHSAAMDEYWSSESSRSGVVMKSEYLFANDKNEAVPVPANTIPGVAGKLGETVAKKYTKVTNKIKNVLITVIPDEKDYTNTKTTTKTSQTNGTVQASALVMQGPAASKIKSSSPKTNPYTPRDLISYVYKPIDSNKKYVHFGTRLRIIGKVDDSDKNYQIVYGDNTYYTDGKKKVTGGGGGIAIMLNPSNNNGYYFEISALSYSGHGDEDSVLDNVFFYKINKDPDDNHASPHAIPVPLFKSNVAIITDDGEFTGQSRTMAEQYPSVYDLSVEYVKISKTWLKFYLYLNGTLIGVVDDKEALPIKNNMALFNRGSSRVMFEHVFALGNRYSLNPSTAIDTGADVSPVFRVSDSDVNKTTAKYALSGILRRSYLGAIDPSSGPATSVYYDEFGTIMREAAYFNIKYDKAYPALFAKLAPTINTNKGYVVSGFRGNSYGAEFMVFNATDTVLNLDSTTGNYLRIQGVTFNQESNYTLTVDEYYNKISDFSNPKFSGSDMTTIDAYQDYLDIKNSRTTYGLKSFSLESPYLQSQDDANKMMGWLMSKISKPRRAIGVSTFGTSYIQLGDILKVDYTDEDGVDQSSSSDARYVVYSMEYRYNTSGPETVFFLSEVS